MPSDSLTCCFHTRAFIPSTEDKDNDKKLKKRIVIMLYKIIFIFTETDSTVVIQQMCTSSKCKQIYVWNSKNNSILRIHGSHCADGTAAKISPPPIRHTPCFIPTLWIIQNFIRLTKDTWHDTCFFICPNFQGQRLIIVCHHRRTLQWHVL
jgi:hypothetical protein